MFPVVLDEVKTVEPPAQNEVLPEIVGMVGKGVTFTTVAAEANEVQTPDIYRTV